MRKCWNCGVPTNDENSRVCSDEICQRAEMKSRRGYFKDRIIVLGHQRRDAYKKEYNQRPEVKERNRKRQHERYSHDKGKEQNPEYKAWQRNYIRMLRQRQKKLSEEE